MKRGLLVFVTALVLICVFAATAMAFDLAPEPDIDIDQSAVVQSADSGIGIMWANISDVIASITISGGTATCKGTVTSYDLTRISMTVRLQKRPANSSTWSNVTNWSDVKDNVNKLTVTGTYSNLDSGFYYRSYVTVNVNGETASLASNEKYY